MSGPKKIGPEWLHSCGEVVSGFNDEFLYSLTKMRASFDVVGLPGGHIVFNHESKHGNWKYFAVLRFGQSGTDGSNEFDQMVFYGEGPGGAKGESLRECRHTYWGDDGYIFYPDGELIAAAFRVLAKFYDEMAPDE